MADQMLDVFQLSAYIDNSVGGWNPESRVNVRLYLAAARVAQIKNVIVLMTYFLLSDH